MEEKIEEQLELSSAKLSSLSWVEIELSLGSAGVEIELRLSLASIWTFKFKYLKFSIEVFEVPFYYFPRCVVGLVGGWLG